MMWLIAQREFRTRTFAKANLIVSAITIVLVIGGALIAKPFLSEEEDAKLVEVGPGAETLIPYLEAEAQARNALVVFEPVNATDLGETPDEDLELPDGTTAILVGPAAQPVLYLEDADEEVMSIASDASRDMVLDRALTDLGGDTAEVSEAIAQAVPSITIVGDSGEFDSGQFFAGMVVILLLFFVLIQSASVIMMGVVEEKSSRVVEILLATVKPATLLGGKVLGVGLYSLVQAATMLIPLLFAGWYLDLFTTLDMEAGPLVANFVIWFLLGFAIYTVFFGGIAALVSRQEDIGAVTTPMMFLMMVPLYLSIYLVPNNPDGVATTVLTQVPFFAPFLVPMRAAFGTISTGETVLAIGICLVTIPILTWIAGKVYAGAVLNTGGRMKFREAFARG
ncbi:ABC transporter permease [Demequina sediminicola]|uniref:ABC transporter permease n=1 Tax=Demequina sediminicola TaxID=1095026 RepID=UPI0007836326|nr:ABC transporter permease [Demequina sediminicola]